MKLIKFGLIILGILRLGLANAQAPDYYTVTIEPSLNGSVRADTAGIIIEGNTITLIEGDTVNLTVLPDKGYELDNISACETDEVKTSVELTVIDDTKYTFIMPAFDVTVTATFRNPDSIAIEEAKRLIESMDILTVPQATANTEATIRTWLRGQINNRIASTNIIVPDSNITITNFKQVLYGVNGSFDFSVLLVKGYASGTARNRGIITATVDCNPKTCILRKSASNILICGDDKGVQYLWGFIDKSTQKEDTIKGEYANYQYVEFPQRIDTVRYEYFVEIKYNDNCSTRTYYPTNACNDNSPQTQPRSKINAYPNPAKQHLSVTLEKDINGGYKVFLRNFLGQTVFAKQYAGYRKNEVVSIDFNLPSGMYLLTIETKDEVLTSKIVIE